MASITGLEANSGSGDLYLADKTGANLVIGGISSLVGLNSGGVINVSNAGSLEVSEDINAAKNVSLTASGVSSDVENFALDPNTTVETTGGSIYLTAWGNLTLNSNSALKTDAPSANARINAGSTVSGAAGSTVTLYGDVRSTTLAINSQSANDSIVVHSFLNHTATTLSKSGSGSYSLSVDGTSGNDAFLLTQSQVQVVGPGGTENISYGSGANALTIFAKPGGATGNDTFTINGTAFITGATINSGSGSNTLTVTGNTAYVYPIHFIADPHSTNTLAIAAATGNMVLANQTTAQTNVCAGPLAGRGWRRGRVLVRDQLGQ